MRAKRSQAQAYPSTHPQTRRHSAKATWNRTVGTQSCNALPNRSTAESRRYATHMRQGRTAHIRREASCANEAQAITYPPHKSMLLKITPCLYTCRRRSCQLFPHRCWESRLCILHDNNVRNPCSRHGPATPKRCPTRSQASRCKNRTRLKGRAACQEHGSSAKQASARRSFQHPIRDIRYCEIGHGDWVKHCTEADMACERRPHHALQHHSWSEEQNQSAWAHMVAAGCSMPAVE